MNYLIFSNRRVRTRTHGGVAGVGGGNRRPYADQEKRCTEMRWLVGPTLKQMVLYHSIGVERNTVFAND